MLDQGRRPGNVNDWLRQIRAVAFDVDGTFYDSRQLWKVVRWSWLRDLRLVIAFDRVREALRETDQNHDLRRLQVEMVAERLQRDETDVRARLNAIFYEESGWLNRAGRLTLYRSFREFLELLVAAGIEIGILSDFPIEPKLTLWGLSGYPWKTQLNTEDLGCLKPSPIAFQQLARDLACDPSEILYVGDKESRDIVGAKRSGIRAARISHRQVSSQADLIFCCYQQLIELFQRHPAVGRG